MSSLVTTISNKVFFDQVTDECISVEDYFSSRQNTLNEQFNSSKLKSLNPDLNLCDIQAQLLLNLNCDFRAKIRLSDIEKNINNIFASNCLEQNQLSFSRRHITGSVTNLDKGESNIDFLLHQSGAVLTSPAENALNRKHRSALKTILQSNDLEVVIPKYKGLTQDKKRWTKLSWVQYKVITALLSGLSYTDTSQLLEMTEDQVSNHAYSARKHLGITLEQQRNISSQNVGAKNRLDPLYGKKNLYKFLYQSEIDDAYELNRLAQKVLSLKTSFSDRQKIIIDLILDGFSTKEIILKTKLQEEQVRNSLKLTKARLLKLLEEKLPEDCPREIDFVKWKNLSAKARKVFLEYVLNGASVEDVVSKFKLKDNKAFYSRMKDTRIVLGISNDQMKALRDLYLIRNSSAKEIRQRALDIVFPDEKPSDLSPQELFKTLCRNFSKLRRNANLRTFKLYLKGLDSERIAVYLGQTKGQAERNINAIAASLRQKMHKPYNESL